MDKKSSRTSKIACIILLKVNLIVMVACTLLFAFALWMIASPSTLSAAIQFTGSNIKALLSPDVLSLQLGVAVAVVAMFLFFIAFMGFYGAINRSPFLLFMYSTMVVLLLFLECALLYYFSSSLIEKGLQEQDGQWTHALRLAFSCCDRNYTIPESKPPWSCCGPNTYPDNCTAEIVYEKNCQETITKWIQKNRVAVYTSLAAIHIILSSCSIVRRRRSASPSLR